MNRIQIFLYEYAKYLKERKHENPRGVYFISPPVEIKP